METCLSRLDAFITKFLLSKSLLKLSSLSGEEWGGGGGEVTREQVLPTFPHTLGRWCPQMLQSKTNP